MSLSDRRRFLLGLAALPLAACGFQPAYGTRGAVQGIQGQVRPQAPKTQEAYDLVNQLERRLGTASAPTFELRYQIKTSTEGLAITRQEVTTGYNILGSVDFQVVNLTEDAVVTQGTISNFVTYSARANPVATRAAERDAQKRLMVILADDLTTRLIATASRWAG